MRKVDIVCRGYGGYNSDHGALILPKILESEKFKLMTLFFGTNDAFATKQGIPLSKYSENIDQMVKLAKSHHIKVIVISPAVHNPAKLAEGEPYCPPGANEKYMMAAKAVAEANDVGFIDLYTKVRDSDQSLDELIFDGIHLSKKGYKILYEELLKEISSRYPELSHEKIPEWLPQFQDLIKVEDKEDMEKLLLAGL